MPAAVLLHHTASEIRELDLHHAAAFLDATPVDAPYGFATAHWLRAWESAFLRGGDWRGPVRVYAKPGAQGCAGFVALADQRIKGMPVKALAGYYWPFRSVCVSAAERDGFAQSLARHFTQCAPATVLRFGPILDRDAGVRAVLRALHEAGWQMLRKQAGDVFTQQLSTVEALHSDMTASLRKSIRQRRRKAASEAGEITYERYPLTGDCGELLDELAMVAHASWQGATGGAAKFLGAAEKPFWQAIAEAGPRDAKPVVWVLRCDRRAIAFQAQIETPGVIYKIGRGHDPAWKAYSPGSLLTYAVLTWACDQGGALIDWGRGDSGYKSTWGAIDAGKLHEVLMFSPGLPGRAALALAQRALAGWAVADDF